MMFWVYPAHVVALGPDTTIYLCLRPRSAGEVVLKVGRATFDPKPARKTIEAMSNNTQTFDEDRAQIECLQAGLNSRYAERYPLGPPDLEGRVWDMFQYLASRLAPKPTRQPKLRRAS